MAIVIPHRPKYRGRLHYIYYLRGDTLCLRTRPTSVADPRTPAQIAQRLKMRLASHFLSGFKPFVEQGFAPAVKENFRRVGAYHCALSHLMRNALVAVDGGMIIDTSRVCLAEGRDNPMLSPKARLEGRSLRITWQGGLPRGCREVLVGIWNRDKGKAKCYNFYTQEIEGSILIKLPEDWKGNSLDIWLAPMGSGERGRYSSVHLQLEADVPGKQNGKQPKPFPGLSGRIQDLKLARKGKSNRCKPLNQRRVRAVDVYSGVRRL